LVVTRRPRSSHATNRRACSLLFGLVATVAFVVRAVYAFGAKPAFFYGNDNTWYVTVARALADGHWGRIPGGLEPRVWSLRFPPGYPTILALGQRVLFWVDPTDADRWASVALGAVAAVAVTWFVWRLCDQARIEARVVAAGVAGLLFALNPIVVGASAALMSEPLSMAIVALTLVQIDRLLARDGSPKATGVVVLGVLLALGALTRVEGILYLGAPVVAAIVITRSRSWSMRPWLGALAIGVVAVIGWSTFGSLLAGQPVFMAANDNPVNGANCRSTQYGDGAGFWTAACASLTSGHLSRRASRAIAIPPPNLFTESPAPGPDVEAEVSHDQLRQGLGRIRDDPVAFLRAEPFRLGRAFGVYWTRTQTREETFEGRDPTWEEVGRWFQLLLVLPLALIGIAAVLMQRSSLGQRLRRLTDPTRLVPALALVPVWLAVTLLTYGSARFRAPVEPVLATLAGLAVALLVTRREATS
jgi:4-amino-4-deoxy-L-arabinose transferase-like glycosyltransferase